MRDQNKIILGLERTSSLLNSVCEKIKKKSTNPSKEKIRIARRKGQRQDQELGLEVVSYPE